MDNETFGSKGAPARGRILIIVMGLALTICPLTLPAQKVALAWTPSSSGNVTGYKLYYGYDGTNFPNFIDAGTNTSVTVSNLRRGAIAYFEVMSYNEFTNSQPSTQVGYFVLNNEGMPTNDVNTMVATTVLSNASNGFALLTSGSGTILPNRSLQAYQAGKTFTLTAAPARGWVVGNWLSNGVVAATTAKYTVTVGPNLVLQANFIPNPYTPTVGIYHGLFWVTNDPAAETSGSFVASVASTGAYSAKLRLGAQNYSFSGVFSAAGMALKTLQQPQGLGPLTVQLELDLTTNGPMTGTISNSSWTADMAADPAIYSAANPAPQAGKYTLVIPGSTNASAQPGGNGFGAVAVSPTGNVTVSGILGDGTPFNTTSVVSTNAQSGVGEWPLYVSLYGGKGSILGWLSFTTNGGIGGQVGWFKLPQATAKLYPEGFTNSTDVIGSPYQYTGGQPVFGSTDALLLLNYGNLSQSVSNQFNIGQNNVATDSTGDKLVFRTASGLFKGSVMNSTTGQPMTVNGVVLQDQNMAAGLFLGATESGSAILTTSVAP